MRAFENVKNYFFNGPSAILMYPCYWPNLEGFVKGCVSYFHQILFFHQMIALYKLWKMLFISSKKLFSFTRYLNFCNFSPSFPRFSDLKGKMKVSQFMTSWTDLHKLSDVIFGITQKPLYITETWPGNTSLINEFFWASL